MNITLVALFLCGRFVTAIQVDDDLYIGRDCTNLLKDHGVDDRYIGMSNMPYLNFFSADETKPYTCVVMQPITGRTP